MPRLACSVEAARAPLAIPTRPALGLLAAVGRATVRTRPRPRVVVISTGSELRDPGTSLGHDSIYDGNSYLLAAAARTAGAIGPMGCAILRSVTPAPRRASWSP